jgi:hypothetical protein
MLIIMDKNECRKTQNEAEKSSRSSYQQQVNAKKHTPIRLHIDMFLRQNTRQSNFNLTTIPGSVVNSDLLVSEMH